MWLWILYNQFGATVGLYKDLATVERESLRFSNSTIKGNFFSLSDFLF